MSDAADDSVGQREVAYRLFAAEFEDADLSYSEGDDERSPNYVITPTGARVNRLFFVGVLTEVEEVSEDVLRGRVVDPTGAFVTYAGQYQPDVQAFLDRVQTPTFVAITGKARTFQPEDSDQVFTSVRPESINEVSAETRDRWTVQAAEQTLDRVGVMGTAMTTALSGDELELALREQGVDEGLAAGVPIALDHYGTTPTYLDAVRELALDAARVVAGERGEVEELRADPDKPGSVSASDVAGTSVETVSVNDADSTKSTTETDETSTTESQGEAATTEGSTTTATTVDTDSHETASETNLEADSATADVDTGTDSDSIASGSETVSTETDDVSGSEPSVTDGPDQGSVQPEPAESATAQESTDDLGDFDPGEFDLEDETREEIEAEFGTEFQTGTEVDEPGEADIDTPAVDETEAEAAEPANSSPEAEAAEPANSSPQAETGESEPRQETESESRVGDEAGEESTTGVDEVAESETGTVEEPEPDSEPEQEQADETGEDTEKPDDIQAAVVDLMGELDDSDGADREALVDEMASRYGVEEDETTEAIQDALMDGECYEPTDGTLKPI